MTAPAGLGEGQVGDGRAVKQLRSAAPPTPRQARNRVGLDR